MQRLIKALNKQNAQLKKSSGRRDPSEIGRNFLRNTPQVCQDVEPLSHNAKRVLIVYVGTIVHTTI